MLLLALLALAMAHNQPTETVKVVDTVASGVVRILWKGPCSPQIFNEFDDLMMIANRYSAIPNTEMRWSGSKWDVRPLRHSTGLAKPTESDPLYYVKAKQKEIRLNHVTIAVECCNAYRPHSYNPDVADVDPPLSAPQIATRVADSTWFPCHDLMNNLYKLNQLPTSVELYSGGWLAAADTNNVDPETSNPAAPPNDYSSPPFT